MAGVHPLVDSSLVIEALRDGALPEGLSLAHSPSPIGLCDRGYAGFRERTAYWTRDT